MIVTVPLEVEPQSYLLGVTAVSYFDPTVNRSVLLELDVQAPDLYVEDVEVVDSDKTEFLLMVTVHNKGNVPTSEILVTVTPVDRYEPRIEETFLRLAVDGRGRDGGAGRGERGLPRAVRHGQGGRPTDRDRRDPSAGEERRPIGRLVPRVVLSRAIDQP